MIILKENYSRYTKLKVKRQSLEPNVSGLKKVNDLRERSLFRAGEGWMIS